MDSIDPEMNQQVEEFNRKLGELTKSLKKEILIAGIMRTKQDLEALNSSSEWLIDDDGSDDDDGDDMSLITPKRAKHLMAAVTGRAIGLVRSLTNGQLNLSQQHLRSRTGASPSGPKPPIIEGEVITHGK